MQMFYPKIVSRSPLKERLPLRTILFPFKIFDIGKNVFCKICLYLDHDISLDEDTAMSFFRLLYQWETGHNVMSPEKYESFKAYL